jgi:hypothetical protein
LAYVISGKVVAHTQSSPYGRYSTTVRFRLAALTLLIVGTAVAHEKATGIVAARMEAMEDTAAQAKALDPP